MSETAFAFEPQLLPGGARFEAIVAAAASFDDRVDGDFFEPVGTGGRELRTTLVAVADQIAGAADLARGKADGVPVVVVRGLRLDGEGEARELVIEPELDLFR